MILLTWEFCLFCKATMIKVLKKFRRTHTLFHSHASNNNFAQVIVQILPLNYKCEWSIWPSFKIWNRWFYHMKYTELLLALFWLIYWKNIFLTHFWKNNVDLFLKKRYGKKCMWKNLTSTWNKNILFWWLEQPSNWYIDVNWGLT